MSEPMMEPMMMAAAELSHTDEPTAVTSAPAADIGGGDGVDRYSRRPLRAVEPARGDAKSSQKFAKPASRRTPQRPLERSSSGGSSSRLGWLYDALSPRAKQGRLSSNKKH